MEPYVPGKPPVTIIGTVVAFTCECQESEPVSRRRLTPPLAAKKGAATACPRCERSYNVSKSGVVERIRS